VKNELPPAIYGAIAAVVAEEVKAAVTRHAKLDKSGAAAVAQVIDEALRESADRLGIGDAAGRITARKMLSRINESLDTFESAGIVADKHDVSKAYAVVRALTGDAILPGQREES
jgi:hypothetical protein